MSGAHPTELPMRPLMNSSKHAPRWRQFAPFEGNCGGEFKARERWERGQRGSQRGGAGEREDEDEEEKEEREVE